MGLAVIVLWAPHLTVLTLDREGLIFKQTGQSVLARPLQRGQVDGRFDQRANWPHRIQRTVETGKAWLTATNNGLHLATFWAGHRHARFHLINPFAPRQTLQRAGQRTFGFQLHDRIEAGENAQTFFSEVLLLVILAQLAFDQVKEGWERAVCQATAPRDAQRFLLRGIHFFNTGDTLCGQYIKHQIAPFQRPLRVAPRVVVGWPFDHTDQQCDLIKFQLGERLDEEVLAGQAKTVHCTLAILTKENLVEVGLKDVLLVVIQTIWDRGYNNMHLMIPFVRVPWEMVRIKDIVRDHGLLNNKGFKLWMMVEVPGAVIMLNEFIELGIDGVSIGTNDLTMMVLGVDRDSSEVAHIYDERHPAVLSMLDHIVQTCTEAGITCSICGQAASDYPEIVERLVKRGVTSVSVNPDAVNRTRALIYNIEKKLHHKA